MDSLHQKAEETFFQTTIPKNKLKYRFSLLPKGLNPKAENPKAEHLFLSNVRFTVLAEHHPAVSFKSKYSALGRQRLEGLESRSS